MSLLWHFYDNGGWRPAVHLSLFDSFSFKTRFESSLSAGTRLLLGPISLILRTKERGVTRARSFPRYNKSMEPGPLNAG